MCYCTMSPSYDKKGQQFRRLVANHTQRGFKEMLPNQTLLVIKKKQYEKVQAAEMNF